MMDGFLVVIDPVYRSSIFGSEEIDPRDLWIR